MGMMSSPRKGGGGSAPSCRGWFSGPAGWKAEARAGNKEVQAGPFCHCSRHRRPRSFTTARMHVRCVHTREPERQSEAARLTEGPRRKEAGRKCIDTDATSSRRAEGGHVDAAGMLRGPGDTDTQLRSEQTKQHAAPRVSPTASTTWGGGGGVGEWPGAPRPMPCCGPSPGAVGTRRTGLGVPAATVPGHWHLRLPGSPPGGCRHLRSRWGNSEALAGGTLP